MADDYIDITLKDEREEGTRNFANLVDPINLDTFIKRVKDTNEKRSLDELVGELLEGR